MHGHLFFNPAILTNNTEDKVKIKTDGKQDGRQNFNAAKDPFQQEK
jgi:hypothetical protein